MTHVSNDTIYIKSIRNSARRAAGFEVETYIIISPYNSTGTLSIVQGETYSNDLSIAIADAIVAATGIFVLTYVSTVSIRSLDIIFGSLSSGSSSSSSSTFKVKRNGIIT